MSASSVAADRRTPRAETADGARVGVAAWMIGIAGSALLTGALVLLVLVERADVPSEGHVSAEQAIVRIVSYALLVPLGPLMLAHVPRHPIGWILCVSVVSGSLATFGEQYAIYSHFVDALPAGEWLGWTAEWAGVSSIIPVATVALLLFPDGRLLSRRWRPALWCGIAAVVGATLEGALSPGDNLAFQGNPFLSDDVASAVAAPFGLGWFLVVPTTIAGIVSLVRRRRTADGEVREQLRLLLLAAGAIAVGFGACTVGALVSPTAFDVGASIALLSIGVIAGMMGVAILRHRLYGLDVFVNRAIVYGTLTVVLAGAYVAAVLLMGEVLGADVELEVALPATALVALAFQPMREWLQRRVNRLLHGQRDEPYAAMSTFGRRLGQTMEPARVLPVMVETIADALRVPYVAVELAGRPEELAAVHGTPAAGVALRVPLVHAGDRVGTLLVGARAHDESLGHADRRLLEDFAHRAAAAASAVALSVEVQRSREKLVSAREEERRRLRGDLHDGLGPTLAGAVLTIDAARRVLANDPAAADVLLDRAAGSIEGTVADVRRLVYGLRPPALDQLGLAGALHQQAATLGMGDPALDCHVNVPDPMPPLPAAVEVAAFRIVQEALTNVSRHARAERAAVTIGIDDAVQLEICDTGVGMPADVRAGVGLTSMRERATELGGTFDVGEGSGGGTVVRARLPLPR